MSETWCTSTANGMMATHYATLASPDTSAATDVVEAMMNHGRPGHIARYVADAFAHFRQILFEAKKRPTITVDWLATEFQTKVLLSTTWRDVHAAFNSVVSFTSDDPDVLTEAVAVMAYLEAAVKTATTKALTNNPHAGVELAQLLGAEEAVRKAALMDDVLKIVAASPGFPIDAMIDKLRAVAMDSHAQHATRDGAYVDINE